MTEVRLRTRVGLSGVRIAVSGSDDLRGAVAAQEGFRMMPLRTYLEQELGYDTVDFSPVPFPDLTAAGELALYDRLGGAMRYMLPDSLRRERHLRAGLGRNRPERCQRVYWQALDQPTRAGLLRAVPVVEQIIDERWTTIGETVNGWRGWMASGRASYDWALNADNTKNQVGTELAEQVVYLNCRADADGALA